MWKSHCQLLGRGDPVSKSHDQLKTAGELFCFALTLRPPAKKAKVMERNIDWKKSREPMSREGIKMRRKCACDEQLESFYTSKDGRPTGQSFKLTKPTHYIDPCITHSPGSATLSRLGGLCVSMTLRAMLAGDLSPGRATHVRKVEG